MFKIEEMERNLYKATEFIKGYAIKGDREDGSTVIAGFAENKAGKFVSYPDGNSIILEVETMDGKCVKVKSYNELEKVLEEDLKSIKWLNYEIRNVMKGGLDKCLEERKMK